MNKINFKNFPLKTVATLLLVAALSMPASLSFAGGGGGGNSAPGGGGRGGSNGDSSEFKVTTRGASTLNVLPNPKLPEGESSSGVNPVTDESDQNKDSCSKNQNNLDGTTEQVICD